MWCDSKEQETCQVEKMGCEGCAYNSSGNENEALKEIAEIEHKLTNFSRQYGFSYDFDVVDVVNMSGQKYDNVNIKVFKELN